jgi:hypothetical protein
MTLAAAQLIQLRRAMELAYVVEIEGWNRLFTNSTDRAGILGAYAGTSLSAATVTSNLELPSDISRALDLHQHTIEMISLTLKFTEGQANETLMTGLFASKNVAADFAIGTAEVNRTATTFPVRSTTGWPSSGGFWNGHEWVSYSSKDATDLLGCTRGAYGFAGKSTWSHDAKLINGVGGTLVGNVESPDVWPGRGVTVTILAKDQFTKQWCTRAQAIVDFVGIVTVGPKWDKKDAVWLLQCESIESKTKTQLLRSQFTATMQGFRIVDTTIILTEYFGDGSVRNQGSFALPAGDYTLQDMCSKINSQITGALLGSLSWKWSFKPSVNTAQGPRAAVWVTVPGAVTTMLAWAGVQIFSGSDVLFYMGIDNTAARAVQFSDTLNGTDQSFSANGLTAPLVTYWDPGSGDIPVTNTQGVWFTQPASTIPPSLGNINYAGFVLVGDDPEPYAVNYNGTDNLARLGAFNRDGSVRNTSKTAAVVKYLGDDPSVPVKQVWLSTPMRASTTLLSILMSTGTASYNDATYDQWPAQMGCSIPSTVIDTAAFITLDTQSGSLAAAPLFLDAPYAVKDLLESFLRTLGAYICWRGGKMSLTAPTHPGALPSQWTLDESNTGADPHCDADDGSDLVRNQLGLQYNWNPETSTFDAEIVFNDASSQAKVELSQGQKHESRFLHDTDGTLSKVQAWLRNVAEPICRYFGFGVWRFTRTGSHGLVGLAVSDVVTFSAQDAPNPQTGARGISSVRAWVVGYSYSPAQREFTSITLLVPAGNVLLLGSSALLDWSRGDHGYDSVNKFLYLRPNEFSLASESADIANFSTGDKIRVIDTDPPTPASPQFWDVTVNANDGVKLTISAALPGFSGSKRYYVIPQPYTSATVAQQEQYAFMGDSATLVIAGTSDPAPLWSQHLVGGDGQYPDSTIRCVQPYDAMTADGAPASAQLVRDEAQNLNTLYANANLQQPVNEAFQADRTMGVSGSLIYGPMPLKTPPGCTTLNVEIYAKVGSAGTSKINVLASITANVSSPEVTFASPEISVTATSMTKYTTTLVVKNDANREFFFLVFSDTVGPTLHVRSVNAWWAQRSVS